MAGARSGGCAHFLSIYGTDHAQVPGWPAGVERGTSGRSPIRVELAVPHFSEGVLSRGGHVVWRFQRNRVETILFTSSDK